MWISMLLLLTLLSYGLRMAGIIRGMILERGCGFSTLKHMVNGRCVPSATGELVFDNVKVPKENILPNVKGLKGPLGCLNSARYGISWEPLEQLSIVMILRCVILKNVFSLVNQSAHSSSQKKAGRNDYWNYEITTSYLEIGSIEKWKSCYTITNIHGEKKQCEYGPPDCPEARQIHGGMGITGEYPIMRHMMNLESVITYEGTHDIHLLITGMDITGISAFE